MESWIKNRCPETELKMHYDQAIEHIQKLEAKLAKFEWQPIETAPKDGTFVLLYWGGEYSVASWFLSHWQAKNEWIGSAVPTRWMPLSQPQEE